MIICPPASPASLIKQDIWISTYFTFSKLALSSYELICLVIWWLQSLDFRALSFFFFFFYYIYLFFPLSSGLKGRTSHSNKHYKLQNGWEMYLNWNVGWESWLLKILEGKIIESALENSLKNGYAADITFFPLTLFLLVPKYGHKICSWIFCSFLNTLLLEFCLFFWL